jgi:hypothetical protein
VQGQDVRPAVAGDRPGPDQLVHVLDDHLVGHADGLVKIGLVRSGVRTAWIVDDKL